MRVVTHLLSTMAATFGNSIWTVLFHPVLPELLLPQVVRDHWALNRYNHLHSESLAKKKLSSHFRSSIRLSKRSLPFPVQISSPALLRLLVVHLDLQI